MQDAKSITMGMVVYIPKSHKEIKTARVATSSNKAYGDESSDRHVPRLLSLVDEIYLACTCKCNSKIAHNIL